jgi:three-Cys-motif partner protein
VTSYVGPAEETVTAMVAAVPRGSLCLAYIDPYNLELLSFSMLRELASLRKVDLVINFSTMDLKRNSDMELDPIRARFDEAAPGWRGQDFAKNSNRKNLSINFFKYWYELMKGLGFESSHEIPLVPNDRGHEIYRLAFFARHKFPIGLWDDVAKDRNYRFDFGE